MLCVECGAAMRQTDEPITDVYKNEEITVEGIPHYKCDACGDTVMDADALGKWATAADEVSKAARRSRKGERCRESVVKEILTTDSMSL